MLQVYAIVTLGNEVIKKKDGGEEETETGKRETKGKK